MTKNIKVNIRDFKKDDFFYVNNIWQETDLGGKIRGDDLDVILKTIENGGKLLIIENRENFEIIGTSWLTNDGRRIYLHHFAIKPAYQRKGYAGQLLDASLKFAKDTGLQIKLEVHCNNVIATTLYTGSGFKYLGDYKVYIIRDYQTLQK